MPIQLLGNRIAVRADDIKGESAGGIVLVTEGRPTTGKVVSIGPGKQLDSGDLIEIAVSVDDSVLYINGSGEEVEIDGEELLIMSEDHVIGILT